MRKLLKKIKGLDLINYYPLIFTVVFVGILLQYKFPSIESVFYDLRVKYDIGTSFNDRIILVTMDEESDEFLGENYPYTFTTHTRLLKRLLVDKPKIVNVFATLGEPISDIEENALFEFKAMVKSYTSKGGSFRFATEIDSWGEKLPPEELRDLGYSPAIINVDNNRFAKDGLSRRAVLNISGEETLHFWTANEFRQKRGESPLKLNDVSGAYYIREADASFSLFRYFTTPVDKKGHIKKVPFHRVLVGNIPTGFFKDKIVLIGPSYISNTDDYVLTPFNRDEATASKLKLHAVIIQALIGDKTVVQLPMFVSNTIAMLIAIFLSLVISRIQPAKGLVITISTILGTIMVSYLLFVMFGLWLYLTHILLTIFIVYYIWVPFRAIGEYQRRYAIQEETKLLKRVESLKQNFISLMSHDLKTPVAKVAGVADNLIVMHGSKSDPEVTKGLKIIIDSTKELNNFITSILDLTKVESEKLSLHKTSKDVNILIEDQIDKLSYEARQNLIEIEAELSPLYPITIDVKLINRVISNLIGNAIKYSGENSKIFVRSWDDEEWVYIEIEDNGVGIPENDLTNIFEKFYRVKNDASHSIKGSGLGLYLVKYFVELHGGTIVAESVLGEGTKFIIKLRNE